MGRRYSLKTVLTLALFASALTCIIIYYVFGRTLGVFTPRFEGALRYGTLLQKIEELYIGGYDTGDMTDNALRGAAYGLDKWSYYMSEAEYSEYINYSNNQFVGIGVSIVTDEETGGMLVMYVYPGSPADAAGIVPSDLITAIDGTPLAGLSSEDVTALMYREIDATMELTVVRGDGREVLLEVEYTYVFNDPVSYALLPGDTGYIALQNFQSGAAEGFIDAMEELMGEGAKAFVFDMRSNPGGMLEELLYILDYLLPVGEIFIDVDRYGRESIMYSDDEWIDIPAVVLINGDSYSAAEYFAVMLSEYGYAETVGERTTGKNRSQITVPLPDGGALHISTAEYLTKNRVSLNDTGGYTPDYIIAMTDDEYTLLYYGELAPEDDPQIQKALLLLLE